MPVEGGALGTVVDVGDGEGEGEVVWASATPKVIKPETPRPAAA